MLFPDLSAPDIHPLKEPKTQTPVAFVADRFLALILDFLIFSPIVSFLLAGLIRQAKTFFMVSLHSQEGLVAAGLIFSAGITIVVLLQSVFLYFWQATPGQFFMQMRVVSYPTLRDRLTYAQCVIRALGFCASFLLLALPFLEVLSHPLRRAFHERASDTVVMTLKQVPDEGPVPLEQRFISSWLQLSYLFIALFALVGFLKTYHSLAIGEYREATPEAVASCKELKGFELQGVDRLDAALSLFVLNEITAECLNKEAEASLWNDPVNSQEMAYLAKYLLAEGDERTEYFKKACEAPTSSSCALAEYLENQDEQRLNQASQKLLITQVLAVEDRYARHDITGSLEEIQKLQQVEPLRRAMDKKYVRSIWALQQEKNANKGSRVPASVDTKPWIEDFKEKYEVQ
ncbi:MAG: RDD family protein [Bacillota bacterium]